MSLVPPFAIFFFFNDTATTEIYTLSLHDALPISSVRPHKLRLADRNPAPATLFGLPYRSVSMATPPVPPAPRAACIPVVSRAGIREAPLRSALLRRRRSHTPPSVDHRRLRRARPRHSRARSRVAAAHFQSRPARCENRESSPGHPRALDIRYCHRADNAPGRRFYINAAEDRRRRDYE